jgi:D-3-phosphoglycerate dehydrogenase / 2-oxoglutarate reductase
MLGNDVTHNNTHSAESATTAPSNEARLFVYDRIDPSDASLDWLEQNGIRVTRGHALWQNAYRYSEDEVISAAQGHDAVMGASGARFTRRVIEALPELRFISKLGIGVETIDMAAAGARGILVSNTPNDLSIQAVAEHTVGFVLGLTKNMLHWTPQFMQSGGWRPGYFSEVLVDKTIGLIGLGRIAREVVKRLKGWDMKIVAYDPFIADLPEGVTMTDLPTLLGSSDIVSLHASPNPDNRHIINAGALARMKKSALLINVGRAWLVDTVALRHALMERVIAGAALDVFDVEPPDPNDHLFRCPNTLFSPHAATWARTALEHTGWQGARNVWSMVNGEESPFILNPEVIRTRAISSQKASL